MTPSPDDETVAPSRGQAGRPRPRHEREARQRGVDRDDRQPQRRHLRASRSGSNAGKLRVEMATRFGQIRAEMAQTGGRPTSVSNDRNAELLKQGLLFGATQVAALAGLIALRLR